ncbi:hypothetical protein G6F32_016736 [Rhizopus arrhizus]|nr:hypothetical protein G6F32_016736 [Rhizopus arrhizus]
MRGLLEAQPAADLRLLQPVFRQPGRALRQIPQDRLRLGQPFALGRQQGRDLPPWVDARKRIGLEVALHNVEGPARKRQAHETAGQSDLPGVARTQRIGQFQRLARQGMHRLSHAVSPF